MELLNKSGKYSKKFEAFTGKLACLDFVDDLDNDMLMEHLALHLQCTRTSVSKLLEIHSICISLFVYCRNVGSSWQKIKQL